MFMIEDNPTFTRDVTFRTPSGTGHREDSVTITFRALDVDEIETADLTSKSGTTAFLNAIVVDAAGFTDGEGKAIATTPKLLERFLALSWVRLPLIHAYFRELAAEREGN